MIETQKQKNIICPHCGFAHSRCLFGNPENGNKRCIECDKYFKVIKNTDLTFNTEKVKNENNH